ncbi:nucleosome assembly factor [Saccharomycopsis crataegensis]|uniref:Histone chaperone n=1 Tax=Saccharomycopsis crataegensis TaxID=43959 RepID=A0AAV5QPW0_9ASCO|nr:nucleosome assembly factor [Saccharomycopsis crataegensis]
MSIVSLLGINVLNNPAKFTDPYEFEITFECLEPLSHDLEWKLTYVGSSRSLDHDQELDSILVGPVPVGVNKFLFQADPPSPELIPASELVSVTVILLSCSYRDREFVRVGYYVNNEYDTEELRENPPNKVQVEHVNRNILAEKPRVTRFNIVWDNEEVEEYPPEQQEADLEEDEEDYAADEIAEGEDAEDAEDDEVEEDEDIEADDDNEDTQEADEEEEPKETDQGSRSKEDALSEEPPTKKRKFEDSDNSKPEDAATPVDISQIEQPPAQDISINDSNIDKESTADTTVVLESSK